MSHDAPTRSRAQRLFVMLCIPLMLVAYYNIDHTWDACAAFGVEYDGTENFTADRLDDVNSQSTSSRLLLAAFATVGFLLPSHKRFGFGQLVLWAAVAYYGWLVFSILWSVAPRHTFYKLAVLGISIYTACGIARQLTSREVMHMLAFCAAGFILIGVVAEIAQGAFQPWKGEYRFTGTVHPNTQSVFAALILLSGLLSYRADLPARHQLLALGMMGFGGLIILMTKSRSALAASLFAMVLVTTFRVRGQKRLFLIIGSMALLIVGIGATSLLGRAAQSQLGSAAAMGRDEDVSTLTGRLPLWELLLEHIEKKPLLGHGYLGFWDAERVEYLGDVFKWEIPHGHNMYLDVLLDGGIVALTLYIAMFLTAMAASVWRYQRTGDVPGLLALGILFFALLHGATESIFKMTSFPSFSLIVSIWGLIWMPSPSAAAQSSAPSGAQDLPPSSAHRPFGSPQPIS